MGCDDTVQLGLFAYVKTEYQFGAVGCGATSSLWWRDAPRGDERKKPSVLMMVIRCPPALVASQSNVYVECHERTSPLYPLTCFDGGVGRINQAKTLAYFFLLAASTIQFNNIREGQMF